MAKQSNSPNQGKYTYDDWVGQVRPDPRNTDQLTLVQGYLGQSSESGHVRVYSDESLNNFVEVPEDAIVHAQQLSPSESSLGGSKLWLRSDAVIVYGDPKSANRPKTTFLEGDLMQQYDAFGNLAGPFRPIASVRCPSWANPGQCHPRSISSGHCPLGGAAPGGFLGEQNFAGGQLRTLGFCQTRDATYCPPSIPAICGPLPQATGFTNNGGGYPYTDTGMCVPDTQGPFYTISGSQCPLLPTADLCPPTYSLCPAYQAGAQPNAGGQFMATFSAIQCGPPVSALVANCTIIQSVANCPASVPIIRCPIASFFRTRCSWSTCFRTICGPQTCLPICGGIPCQFGSVTVPITTTRTVLTETITGPTGPGGPVIQPGGFMGQPDTTMMGGYYGTFNPYMM